MRKRILAAATVILIAGSTHAQSTRWNARAGWQMSSGRKVDKDNGNVTNGTSIQGFTASIGMKADFDNRLYFAPRLQYSTNGLELPGETNGDTETYRLHYIEIPMLFHIELGRVHHQGLYTEFGPALGYAFSGSVKTSEGTDPLVFSMTQYNPVNVSVSGILGYHFSNGLFVDAGYHYGLVSITNGDTKPKMRTAQAGVGIGYYFRR